MNNVVLTCLDTSGFDVLFLVLVDEILLTIPVDWCHKLLIICIVYLLLNKKITILYPFWKPYFHSYHRKLI